MIIKSDVELEPPKEEEEEEETTTQSAQSTTKTETQQLQQELHDLRKFHRSHPDLPQPDILYEEEETSQATATEEEAETWEESAQQSFWWETTSNIPTEEPKEESPYSIMSKKFISRTPESELEHPTAVGTSPVEKIVEESYQKLVEEKTRPEFTLETMPERIYSEGNLVFWRPTEYYYWYLLTKRQFEERGIPYTEEELKKFARERHRVYTEYMEFLEVLPKIDQSKLEGIDLKSLRRDVERFLFSPPAVILTRKELHQLSMEKLLKLEEDIMKTAHPQEVPGIMASLHSELEYALEKYFPTPDIPESTLAGKGIAWTKGLPPMVREVAQFGVGIV
ncbi:MAG: hypothetical protein DRJ36_02780, partial [Thermoprotei archaeon]